MQILFSDFIRHLVLLVGHRETFLHSIYDLLTKISQEEYLEVERNISKIAKRNALVPITIGFFEPLRSDESTSLRVQSLRDFRDYNHLLLGSSLRGVLRKVQLIPVFQEPFAKAVEMVDNIPLLNGDQADHYYLGDILKQISALNLASRMWEKEVIEINTYQFGKSYRFYAIVTPGLGQPDLAKLEELMKEREDQLLLKDIFNGPRQIRALTQLMEESLAVPLDDEFIGKYEGDPELTAEKIIFSISQSLTEEEKEEVSDKVVELEKPSITSADFDPVIDEVIYEMNFGRKKVAENTNWKLSDLDMDEIIDETLEELSPKVLDRLNQVSDNRRLDSHETQLAQLIEKAGQKNPGVLRRLKKYFS